ncbi:uncharacterized protein LOC123540798 isoform X2 [Mercenaria mercenaria]|nr:uncharacterized protein LOC123540798 isoform X2 [Mercenaria mercenaria]
MSSSATHYPVVKEQLMVSLLNPFCVQLDHTKCSSLKEGLFLTLSMKKASKVKVLWGVDTQRFQEELQFTSIEIADRFTNNKIFDERYKHAADCGIIQEVDGYREIYFKCPGELSEEVLGEPPRTLYPVVVVSQLEECNIQQDSTAIVIQFTVIHLKDSVCSLDSHIVYQFVKTNHNKLMGLQPIFVSTTEPDRPNTSKRTARNGKNSSVINSSSQNHVQSNEIVKGEGHTLSSSSSELQHCKSCGKIRKHVENIPSTREHEKCDCKENDLEKFDNERSDVKVTGQENITKEGSDEENDASNENRNDFDSVSEMKSGQVEDIAPEIEELESCCVCQSLEIFYTLLPCRHACVCSMCIRLLDKCPICRSYIEAYFRLHSRVSEQELRDSMERSNAGPRLNRWQALNRRLNEMFGFV